VSQANTVKEVLIAARWMIENVGWCKGIYTQYPADITLGAPNPRPCAFCATGAIYHVEAEAGLRSAAESFLERSLGVYSVPTWNDYPETTKEQVLQAFDLAIGSVYHE
jgi:hypothetical protein